MVVDERGVVEASARLDADRAVANGNAIVIVGVVGETRVGLHSGSIVAGRDDAILSLLGNGDIIEVVGILLGSMKNAHGAVAGSGSFRY